MPQCEYAMKLLIISGMSHYSRDAILVGWGPTAQEIDHLATLFDQVRHIGVLHRGPAPGSALPYASTKVTFIPMCPAGGPRLRDKAMILLRYPGYLAAILRELPESDVVHVRCPDNISMLAIVVLAFVRRPKIRWVKYAGNWKPTGAEASSYRFQRWWLARGFHRGTVTVNGNWPEQPAHVASFINPCLTDSEIGEAERKCAGKLLTSPLRCILVGRVETEKGVGRALEILARLKAAGCDATLDIVGDGPGRAEFEEQAHDLGVSCSTTFHGWLPRTALSPLFTRAHVTVFPSETEGWPKVLSEGMAYGVVPVASRVSCIPQYLEKFGTGRTFDAHDVNGFVGAIAWYVEHPSAWKEESQRAVVAARLFSYSRFLEAVRALLEVPAGRTAPAR